MEKILQKKVNYCHCEFAKLVGIMLNCNILRVACRNSRFSFFGVG